MGEFNSDGRKDLAMTGDGVWVALGYGDGTFRTPGTMNLGGLAASPEVQESRSVNSMVTGFKISRLLESLSVESRYFWAMAMDHFAGHSTSRPAALARHAALAVAEFNRDGIQDLVIASSGSVAVLLGNGNGTFQPPVTFPAVDAPSAIVVGYFNGDAFQDLAVLSRRQPYRGAAGKWRRDIPVATVLRYWDSGEYWRRRSLALGDFNGDGNQDLVATNAPAASISVLLGNGDGTFRSP